MVQVREIGEEDIRRVAELEREIFPDPWSERSLQETKEQSRAVIFGGWLEDVLCGYVILYYVLDEGEIARIAVDPACRRRGAAAGLLRQVEHFCEERGIARVMLEVRESNEGARAFYRSQGFLEDGVRRGFYENPREDAVLMSRVL